jgi:hypothetical protein
VERCGAASCLIRKVCRRSDGLVQRFRKIFDQPANARDKIGSQRDTRGDGSERRNHFGAGLVVSRPSSTFMKNFAQFLRTT